MSSKKKEAIIGVRVTRKLKLALEQEARELGFEDTSTYGRWLWENRPTLDELKPVLRIVVRNCLQKNAKRREAADSRIRQLISELPGAAPDKAKKLKEEIISLWYEY